MKSKLRLKAEEVDNIRQEFEDSKTNFAQLLNKFENLVNEKKQMEINHDESNTENQENIRRITEEKRILEEKCDVLKQQLSTFFNIQVQYEALEHENNELKKRCESSQNAAQENAEKLLNIEKMTSDTKTKLESIICEKNNEIEILRERLHILEVDLSSNHGAVVNELENTIQKLHTEKEDLEFQLDSLREDQDVTLEESLAFQKEISVLKAENEQLKTLIHELRASNESGITITESSSMISTGSAWASEKRLSYGTSAIEAVAHKSPENPPPSHKSPDTEAIDADESFDEDVFLPDDFLPNTDNGTSSSANECVNQSSVVSAYCPTPQKTGEYGKRRPLSDRKNTMTPHKSTSKKLKSTSKFMASARKLMSSSKKKKDGDYMVFNNKRLFGE
jgi:DNA-binding transcriptional regulator YiaG